MTQAYPLQWPEGWERTPAHQREDGRAKFRRGDWRSGYRYLTVSLAIGELIEELRLMGATKLIVSSNIALRLDGYPRSGQKIPDDPGVGIFFNWDGEDRQMARDAYIRPEENIRSLALVVNGLRQVERHGGSRMFKKSFEGFMALPPPSAFAMPPPEDDWWTVLGVPETALWQDIRSAYRAKSREADEALQRKLNAAYERARAER
jgi:hypothetical protein